MRENIHNHIIKNFVMAKSLGLKAISNYLTGRRITGDRDGRWHGSTGTNRALKLKQYLESVKAEDHSALLAIFIAIFGDPNAGFLFWAPGRSSRLAELITEEWIHGIDPNFTSEVFEQEALDTIGSHAAEPATLVEGTDFEIYKRGVATLLKAALEQPEFKKDYKKIQMSIKSLTQILDGSGREIDMRKLPSTPIMEKIYAIAAIVGAFSNTIFPEEIRIKIGVYLTRSEAARSLVSVNLAAAAGVRVPEVLHRNIKTHPLIDTAGSSSQRKAFTRTETKPKALLHSPSSPEQKIEVKEVKVHLPTPLSSSRDLLFNSIPRLSQKISLPSEALKLREKASPVLIRREVKEHIKRFTESAQDGDLATCRAAIEYLEKMSLSPFCDCGAEQFLKNSSTQEMISKMNTSPKKADKSTSINL